MENWTDQSVQVKGEKVLKRSLKLGVGRVGKRWKLLKPWRWHERKNKTNQLIFLFYMIFKMADRLSEETLQFIWRAEDEYVSQGSCMRTY